MSSSVLRSPRIGHVSSTLYGGGVAEILTPLTLLMNTMGIATGWHVIQGTPELFSRTKKIHNGLQGAHVELSGNEKAIYARALSPSAPLSDDDIDAATHIVGMMGVEPIQQALTAGAQIIVAGRSGDTSIFAALPLLEGYAPAVVWHMAKILECGAAAVAVRTAPDCSLFAARDRPRPSLWVHLNHLLVPDGPTALFRTEYEEV